MSETKSLLFEKIEPWQDDDIVFPDLLNEISQEISKYSILPAGANEALTLWTFGTYIFDHQTLYPNLLFTSPEKRCGKTTLLMVTESLVRHPLVVSNITSAALFRIIEMSKPTLLLDEGDTFLREKAEMIGIMNGGHTKKTAQVVRCDSSTFEPKAFSTWCPKVIAMIGKPAETLIDRSIVIQLKRKLLTEKTERIREADKIQFEHYRRKLLRIANEFGRRIAENHPEVPECLHSRAADNWESLIAIADFASEEWGRKARNAAITLTLSIDSDEENHSILLLRDIAEIFAVTKAVGLSSKSLCTQLNAKEESPWGEFGGIDPRKLAKLLAPFDIRPSAHRNLGNQKTTLKGYVQTDFADAFSRYLKPVTAVTPLQPNTKAIERKPDDK